VFEANDGGIDVAVMRNINQPLVSYTSHDPSKHALSRLARSSVDVRVARIAPLTCTTQMSGDSALIAIPLVHCVLFLNWVAWRSA
jgi:hypothetical protein